MEKTFRPPMYQQVITAVYTVLGLFIGVSLISTRAWPFSLLFFALVPMAVAGLRRMLTERYTITDQALKIKWREKGKAAEVELPWADIISVRRVWDAFAQLRIEVSRSSGQRFFLYVPTLGSELVREVEGRSAAAKKSQ